MYPILILLACSQVARFLHAYPTGNEEALYCKNLGGLGKGTCPQKMTDDYVDDDGGCYSGRQQAKAIQELSLYPICPEYNESLQWQEDCDMTRLDHNTREDYGQFLTLGKDTRCDQEEDADVSTDLTLGMYQDLHEGQYASDHSHRGKSTIAPLQGLTYEREAQQNTVSGSNPTLPSERSKEDDLATRLLQTNDRLHHLNFLVGEDLEWKKNLIFKQACKNYCRYTTYHMNTAKRHLALVGDTGLVEKLLDNDSTKQYEAAMRIVRILKSEKNVPHSYASSLLGKNLAKVTKDFVDTTGLSSTSAWRHLNNCLTEDIARLLTVDETYDQGMAKLLALDNALPQRRGRFSQAGSKSISMLQTRFG